LSEQSVELDDCFVSFSVDIKIKINFTSIYSYYKTIGQFVNFDIQRFVQLELEKSDAVSISQQYLRVMHILVSIIIPKVKQVCHHY
jgi:hypothetical protein